MTTIGSTVVSARADVPSPAELFDLYRDQQKRIFRICLGYLRNAADAEDACQETFVRAARHLPQLSGEPAAYLTVIARNVCCDELRRRARASVQPTVEPSGDERKVDAESAVIARALLRGVWRQLQHHEREHLLDSFAGYSYDEIARRSGLSVPATASIISRARQRARRAAEAVASVLLAPFVTGRLAALRAARRVANAPSEVAAAASLGMQAGGLLAATVVTALISGGLSSPLSPGGAAGGALSTNLPHHADGAEILAAQPLTAVGGPGGPASRRYQDPSGPAATGPAGGATGAITALLPSSPPPRQQDASISSVAASPDYQHDGTIYASGTQVTGCQKGTCPVLFRSTDRGATWTALPGTGFAGGALLLPPEFPTDPSIYAAGPSGLQVSRDGGASFAAVSPIVGPAAMAPGSATGTARILIGSQPLMEYDSATGRTTPGPVLPLTLTSIDSVAFAGDAQHIVVTGSQPDPSGSNLQDGVVIVCSPSCREALVAPNDGFFHVTVSPTFQQDQTFFVSSPKALYVTHDGGNTMSTLPLDTVGSVSSVALAPLFSSTRTVAIATYTTDSSGGYHPGVSVSSSGGSLTRTAGAGLPDTYLISALTILPDGRILAGLSYGSDGLLGIRCSHNDGTTWSLGC